jgi:hypothetical protein
MLSRISVTIFFKYGFFICFIKIVRAHLISIPEFTKIENLLINCHNSFFETLLKSWISMLAFAFLAHPLVLCAFLDFSNKSRNFVLSKFQCLS